jgi:E3 ubiquitin-protein ligase MARCH6
MKFVHESCLLEWLKVSTANSGKSLEEAVCDLCRHPFTFTEIYADNTPPTLSPLQFAKGLASRCASAALTTG